MNITLQQTRSILDQLRDAGLSTQEIADRLALRQIKLNERSVRKMYSGTTDCYVVVYRALRDLLHEVK